MNWDWEVAQEMLPALLDGLKLTVYATIMASVISILLGLFWAIARRSPFAPIRVAIDWFTEFIRRTPLLVQLYFIFFVFPSFGILLPALLAGIIGLGLNYSTFTMQIYRAGIDSIAKGQWEAAQVLDLSRTSLWLRVILPQAVPRVIPPLGNTIIAMFKETALLSAISVQEMMGVAKGLGADRFDYTEPLFLAAAMYLVLGYGSSVVIRQTERALDPSRRAARRSTQKVVI